MTKQQPRPRSSVGRGATIAQAARLPVDLVKVLMNHNDKGVIGIYARWHMFEEKRDAVMAIDEAVSPLIARILRDFEL
jgi:hypothetical protein